MYCEIIRGCKERGRFSVVQHDDLSKFASRLLTGSAEVIWEWLIFLKIKPFALFALELGNKYCLIIIEVTKTSYLEYLSSIKCT